MVDQGLLHGSKLPSRVKRQLQQLLHDRGQGFLLGLERRFGLLFSLGRLLAETFGRLRVYITRSHLVCFHVLAIFVQNASFYTRDAAQWRPSGDDTDDTRRPRSRLSHTKLRRKYKTRVSRGLQISIQGFHGIYYRDFSRVESEK